MVLLLTGAIDIKEFNIPSTTITDINERLSQYLNSIDFAITHYQLITDIVFCENTGFIFDYAPLKEKALANGKNLEIISFKGDYTLIEKKGKGFGEGEIIKYALNTSKILAEYSAFFKLTGRLIVKNMDRIVATTKSENSFIYHPKTIYRMPVDHIETFFYKVDKTIYIENLIDAFEEVDESCYRYLEHIFYERLFNFNLLSFKIAPQISGISGTSGDSYLSGAKATVLEKINYFIGVHNLKKTIPEKGLTVLLSYLLKITRMLK